MNVKPENYISIQGWMITELGLKNSELMIYALIYGFSQDGRSAFTGNIAYLQEWTQASRQTVHTCLNALMERGLITKIEVTVGGAKAIGYRAAPREDGGMAEDPGGPDGGDCPKIGHDCQKFGHDCQKFGHGTVQNLDTDNKRDINNKYNKHTTARARAREEDEAREKERLTAEFAELWKLYPRRQGENEALTAYIHARRSGTSREEILAGILEYKRYIDLSEMPMRYVMQGGNWFFFERWKDEPVKLDSRKPADKPARALNYKQRKYTAEELAALGVDLGEGIYEETDP